MCGSEQTLKLITCNIEGAISNKNYLQKLCKSNHIICIQEHWLWEFQKHWLDENIPDLQIYSRCHDSNDNIQSFNIPRGRSGVAIMWQNCISDKLSKLDVGNERVIAIEVNLNTKLCIINAYMPTNKSDSEFGYRECLDVIHDIIRRYEPSHTIVLCGDLNGTLLETRNNKHDIMLKDFVNEHCLSTGSNLKLEPTFYHFNGVVTSQIDYILCSDTKLLKNYTIFERQAENLFPHVPVMSELSIPTSTSGIISGKEKAATRKTYSWNKLDKEKYSAEIAAMLPTCGNENVESTINSLTECLKRAAQKAVPSKIVKLKGPKKRASQKVLECLKTVKQTHRKWVEVGKPCNGQLYIENKLAKKQLRSQQRIEETVRRKTFYENLMENPTSDMFYKLIKKSRSKRESNTSCLLVNGNRHCDPAMQRKCFAEYYEDLALPKDHDYDNVFLNLCNIHCNDAEDKCLNSDDTIILSEEDVEKAIDKLNTGKSSDEYGLFSEHFKSGKSEIVPAFTKVFNKILSEKKIPSTFKTGVITPVLKKGKDSKLLENYRGITISSIFGKLFECALLTKFEYNQSDMQFGFTEGLSPMMASLIVSEAKAESSDKKSTVSMATLDSQKAFDVVHHSILLDKLFDKDINDTTWLVIKELYQDISSKVKWVGGLSDSFPINQGVRQGAILSTHLYKIYIDELLNILKSKRLGLRIGTIYIGSPTCADDVALLASSVEELQLMLEEAVNFARKNRYKIHPTKTCIVVLSNKIPNKDCIWSLGENTVQLSEGAPHLGINRAGKQESATNVKDRISLARRTSYSLMNTGMHGSTGLNPKTSFVIYKTYVLPRLLYGHETLALTKGQIEQLSRYHIQTLRNIQSLPQRTSTSAVLLLLGALPLEAELHRKKLSLAISVINSVNPTLKLLVQRQLACSHDIKNSFFNELTTILQQYKLPSLCQLFSSSVTKLQWKHMCRKAINSFWTKQLVSDIKTKKTLKYLSCYNLSVDNTHLVWRTVDNSVMDVRKAVVKARILTGTYILQKNRQTFSNGTVSSECRHCHLEEEDLLHLVSRCPAFLQNTC